MTQTFLRSSILSGGGNLNILKDAAAVLPAFQVKKHPASQLFSAVSYVTPQNFGISLQVFRRLGQIPCHHQTCQQKEQSRWIRCTLKQEHQLWGQSQGYLTSTPPAWAETAKAHNTLKYMLTLRDFSSSFAPLYKTLQGHKTCLFWWCGAELVPLQRQWKMQIPIRSNVSLLHIIQIYGFQLFHSSKLLHCCVQTTVTLKCITIYLSIHAFSQEMSLRSIPWCANV